MVMFFESALGNWDFSIYDQVDSELKRWYGITFHIIVLLVNMLLLLNRWTTGWGVQVAGIQCVCAHGAVYGSGVLVWAWL